jgi:hypothetical protein
MCPRAITFHTNVGDSLKSWYLRTPDVRMKIEYTEPYY